MTRPIRPRQIRSATVTTVGTNYRGMPISLSHLTIQVLLSRPGVPMFLQTYPGPGEIRNRDEWRFSDD